VVENDQFQVVPQFLGFSLLFVVLLRNERFAGAGLVPGVAAAEKG
jgi:hypothetical protein